MMKRVGAVLVLFCVMFLVSGCCTPPREEISQTRAILLEAKKMGAMEFSKDKFQKAQDLLAQAEAESKTECRKSWKTVMLAKMQAEEAKKEAAARQAAYKTDAEKYMAKAQKLIKEGRESGDAKYALDLFEVAENTLNDARQAYADGNYRDALGYGKEAYKLAKRAVVIASHLRMEAEKGKEVTLERVHVVRKGECLWKISGYTRVYHNPFMWPLIYKANQSKIKDPDLIYPKQIFSIPRDYSEGEKAAAIHQAKTRGPWSLTDGK
jgi:nucleoid-associated protein YgaU